MAELGADQRLREAAPDLLAACMKFITVRQHPFGDPYIEDVQAAVDAGVLAVYKALGRDVFAAGFGPDGLAHVDELMGES